MPVANTSATASPWVQAVPLKTTSVASVSGLTAHARVGRAQHRQRLAGQRGDVHLDRARQDPRISRDTISFADDNDVSRHQHLGVYELMDALAQYARMGRQECRQCLDGLLGVPFLREREQRVDDDDHDDGHSEGHGSADAGQRGSQPQEQRERVDQLVAQLSVPLGPGRRVRALGPTLSRRRADSRADRPAG